MLKELVCRGEMTAYVTATGKMQVELRRKRVGDHK